MTIRGDEHLAECIKYIPSRATFLGVSNTKQPSRELYYEFGTKEIVPLSALTRPYKREFAKSDWMYDDYDPKKKGNRNFWYCTTKTWAGFNRQNLESHQFWNFLQELVE